MLSPYRVLDLSDHRGIVCSFMLGELGADVVCVEPPGGSSARQRGPFEDDVCDSERSLFWWAYARNKRSVVLDPESPRDREALLGLVESADVLVESAKPGEMERLGLGYSELSRLNPALVYVSITPFGQTGPKAGWAGTDLTVLAAGGVLGLTGDADRAPVRISVPQAFAHAAAEAAAAALVALRERQRSGRGQHVDVSAQQAVTLATQADIVSAAVNSAGAKRLAGGGKLGGLRLRLVFPARDGHVSITYLFGPAMGPASARLMRVVCEEGFCDEALRDTDWIRLPALIAKGAESAETFERAKRAVAAWTASKTKAELLAVAMERRLLVAPASTLRDVVSSAQLAGRDYFQELERPAGGGVTRQLGPFLRRGDDPPRPARAAPRIGEHAAEVLADRRRPALAESGSKQEARGTEGLPLAGVKILDFTWAIAGPAATRMLADYGAEVVRIESRSRPDAIRGGRPFVDRRVGNETGALFHGCNASKLMLGLDLAKPESRDVVVDLVRWADVVCESFSPGVMEGLGFGYRALREIDPSIILLSTSLMGQSGPLAKFAGYGNLSAAIVGFHELTGWPDRDAAGPYSAYTDYVAPKFNAVAVLAALDHRRRTGEGQHLDVSQAEAALHFLAPALLDALVNDRAPTRRGNRDERFAPHGCYPVLGDDRWIAIAVESDSGWVALCERLGRPELAADPRFSKSDDRLRNVAELDCVLAELTAEWDGTELEASLQARGVACHRVLDSEGAVADPQLRARGHFVRIEDGETYTVVEDTRSKLSRTPAEVRRGIPTLGRDNQEVLERLLGYDEDRIAELAIAGAIE
ncbi:MAG: CaiB/BaiF CoA transferase family protein [Myxococcota bacterium]